MPILDEGQTSSAESEVSSARPRVGAKPKPEWPFSEGGANLLKTKWNPTPIARLPMCLFLETGTRQRIAGIRIHATWSEEHLAPNEGSQREP